MRMNVGFLNYWGDVFYKYDNLNKDEYDNMIVLVKINILEGY